MALQLFPGVSKTTTTSDGTKYAYVSIPARSESNPTLLLLHGFPSGTFDWRHMIPKLRQAGYGIIAPDLLGYGDTDKPAEVEAYSKFRMAKHMVEILKAEGLNKVIGVGHDWGCALLSTTALTYPDYFSGLVFLAVGYVPPGPFNIDLVNSLSVQHFGYPCWGYMKFFIEDDAAAIIDAHAASLTSLLYSHTPEDWKVHMGPEGAAREWVTANKIAPPPSWMTQEEVDTHTRLFEKGGYTGPLNWYKSYARGIEEPHYSKLTPDESKRLDIPALIITAEYDYVCHAAFQRGSAEKYLPNHRIEQLTCSHWIPSEMPDETVRLMEDWIKNTGFAS